MVVQADAAERMQPDDLLRMTASNARGQLVPLSELVRVERGVIDRHLGERLPAVHGHRPARARAPAGRR